MIRFESTQYFYLFLLLPLLLLVLVKYAYQYRKTLSKIGDVALVKKMIISKSLFKKLLRFSLLILSISLLIVCICRPQTGKKAAKKQRQGIEVVIAMDISNSMLAKDVAPSRLEKSKLLVENLSEKLSDDKIGLIVYAGDAFVQMPLTKDDVSVKMFTETINPSMISTQGTDIAAALSLSLECFSPDKNIGKAIVLITDGEDHEGKAIETAREVAKKGVKLFILGVGTKEGAPIDDTQGEYLKDENGEIVVSRLNVDICKNIASAGDGAFIYVDNSSNAFNSLEKELSKIQKGRIDAIDFDEKTEYFQLFALLAFVCLLLEMFLTNRKRFISKRRTVNLPSSAKIIIVVLCLLPFKSYAQSDRDYIRKGNRQFHKGQIDASTEDYLKAIKKNPKNARAYYNAGRSYMDRQDAKGNVMGDSAVMYFSKAASLETDKKRKAMSYHNMGVVFQANEVYDKAIEAYKEALRNNPNDDETRYNLIVCMKKQKQKNDNKQNQNQNNQSQNKQNNDKQDNKNNNDKQQKDKQEQKQKDNQQNKMSQDNARAILKAAQREEQKTHQKLQNAKKQNGVVSNKKNW